MIQFTTESGSVYQLDTEKKCIRRMQGTIDPTPRQGKDGEWKAYSCLQNDPEVGKCLLICWQGEKHTLTSVLVSMTNVLMEA